MTRDYIPENIREAARWTCTGQARWCGGALQQLWQRDDGVGQWRDVPREPGAEVDA